MLLLFFYYVALDSRTHQASVLPSVKGLDEEVVALTVREIKKIPIVEGSEIYYEKLNSCLQLEILTKSLRAAELKLKEEKEDVLFVGGIPEILNEFSEVVKQEVCQAALGAFYVLVDDSF